MQRRTAQSMLADRSTMTPALPPSSSTTFFLPARSFIFQPTAGLPVKVRSLNRSSVTIRSPSSRVIGRMLTEPSGRPASAITSATVSIVSGARDGGFRTMGAPGAVAGASVGKAAGHAQAAARGRFQVQRYALAADSPGLLGADAEGQDAAIHFGEGVANRLAGFGGDEPPDLLAACLDAIGDLAKCGAALVGRQLAGLLEGGDGGRHGLLVLLGRGVVRPARRFIRPGRIDDHGHVRRFHPPAGQEDRMRFRFGRRGHAVSEAGRQAAPQAVAPQLRQLSLLSVQSEPQFPLAAQISHLGLACSVSASSPQRQYQVPLLPWRRRAPSFTTALNEPRNSAIVLTGQTIQPGAPYDLG